MRFSSFTKKAFSRRNINLQLSRLAAKGRSDALWMSTGAAAGSVAGAGQWMLGYSDESLPRSVWNYTKRGAMLGLGAREFRDIGILAKQRWRLAMRRAARGRGA